MANINILFDNKNYNIDESAFSSASAKLKNHLSTIMNGSGAVINIGGIPYNVDSAKLTTAMNAFTTHLGTISGSGSKLVVNGVQYNINSAKLSDAITELHNVLGGLHSDGGETTTSIAYGCKYRLNGVQSNGYVVMHENGTLKSYNIDDTLESSITVQYVISNDGKTSVNVDGAEVGYVTADGKTFYMFMGEENGERIYYPFYLEESDNEDEQREVILAEQVVEEFLEEEQGLYGAYMINNLDLFEIGRTYIVNWDGTEYRYEAVELEGVGVIGEEDSKNPFLMVVMPKEYTNLSGNALAIYTTSTQSTHTVAIYKVVDNNDNNDGLNEYGFYYDTKYSLYNFSTNSGFPVGEIGVIFKENATADMYLNNTFLQTVPVTYSDEIIIVSSLGATLSVRNNGKELHDPLMATFKLGDAVIIDGDYTYKIVPYTSGLSWDVMATDKTKSSYGTIKNEIDGYPVVALSSTFENCTNLTIAPAIPPSTIKMVGTFRDCNNLTTAPVIPSNVINMTQTFMHCDNLTGNIEINANPTEYEGCFYGIEKPITIIGLCSDETKAALAATANNGNVTY